MKICCIQDREEAWLAIRLGAAAIGLVSAMPSGPGVIDDKAIATIAAAIPPTVDTFLLTSRTDPAAIVAQHHRAPTRTLQLVDRIEPKAYGTLRRRLPGVSLVQVVHVTGPEALEQACAVAGEVDALLLDSGDPNRSVKELGGTGRTHDWAISRRIREAVPVPVLLAGGLDPDNVAEAVHAVEPFAVDVCSGVRTDGRLDASRLEAFLAAVAAPGSVEITR